MYATRALWAFRPTARMMRPASNQQQGGILNRLRNVPAELLPLGVVVGFAVFAAGYSITRHLFVDSSIRLKRLNRAAESASHAAHAPNNEDAHSEPVAEASATTEEQKQ